MVAEPDGIRITAVLSANPDFQFRVGLPAQVDANRDEPTHALFIQGLERIPADDPRFDIVGQKSTGVKTARRDAGGDRTDRYPVEPLVQLLTAIRW